MRKTLPYYILSVLSSLVILFFLINTYQNLKTYAALNNRHNTALGIFQNLSRELNNAAILNPSLTKKGIELKAKQIFYVEKTQIVNELDLLKSTVKDSVNTRIAAALDTLVKSEIDWIIQNNVPDSISTNNAPAHIAAFEKIDSLLHSGIERQDYLIQLRKQQLSDEILRVKTWMIAFIILSGIILFVISFRLFRQQSKTKQKERELEIVLNRISDGVVSVDNEWRYTFLNDAAMATHPFSKEKTIGKVIWDVHPEMKGTIFWDKYREAMIKKEVMEIESHYAPMDIWFSVKIYPSEHGLTIFYKNVTESKKAELQISKTLKEITDYKFALDEACIVAITDQKGIIKHANLNFCKISKYTEEELLGQDHRIINSGYHSKEFIRDLWTTIANGRIWKGELKNKAKDGTVYWVDTTIVPFLDEKGKPYQYVAIRADITERKKAEEDLVLSEMHFRSLIENSAEGITMTDKFSNLIYRSPGSEKITGVLPKENVMSLTHPDDMQLIQSKYAELINNPGIAIGFQGRFLHASGKYIWLEGTFTNLLHVNGVNAIISNYRDITHRKEAEAALIKSEKIYKTIASSIPGSVICMLDAEYRYLLIEGDMIEKIGYSKEKLLGNKAEDVLPSELFAQIRPQLDLAFSGEIVTRETHTDQYDTISTYIPLKDEHNQVYHVMTVTTDVTKLKNAQRDIINLNHGLEEKIIIRTEELKRSTEEMEAFSYSVSHDLRSPLRSIIGFTTILEEDYGSKLDDEAKRITGIIKNSSMKMGQLIDDLLTFARTGKQVLSKSIIDTNEMVQSVIDEMMQLYHNPEKIKWSVENLPLMNADMNTIRQVWINLLSNAIKYSSLKKSSQIEIGSYNDNQFVVFFVKDNGAGFDQAYADKLFKVFQRLHDAQEFEGTGVGLALVEKIISRHGGKVWARGKQNDGAIFYFSLPV